MLSFYIKILLYQLKHKTHERILQVSKVVFYFQPKDLYQPIYQMFQNLYEGDAANLLI